MAGSHLQRTGDTMAPSFFSSAKALSTSLRSAPRALAREWQPYFRPQWQWLTLDGSREEQSWATKHTIRYDRTEYRWTVEIPEAEESQLYDMERLEAAIPGTDALFLGWPGSENWRVYRGNIPRKWLKKLEHWNRITGRWENVAWTKH